MAQPDSGATASATMSAPLKPVDLENRWISPVLRPAASSPKVNSPVSPATSTMGDPGAVATAWQRVRLGWSCQVPVSICDHAVEAIITKANKTATEAQPAVWVRSCPLPDRGDTGRGALFIVVRG